MYRISTEYVSHPSSNVGSIRARLYGKQRTVRCQPQFSSDQNHHAAAVRVLDAILDGQGLSGEYDLVWTEGNDSGTRRLYVAHRRG